MKRRGGTLYEVAKGKLGADGASQRPTAAGSALQPGSAVRVPVGMVIVAIVVVGLIIVAAWRMGASSGDGQGQDASGPSSTLVPPGPMIDPLQATPEVPTAPEDAVEPRVAGKWYFVLAETRPEGARRLAAYCVANGLDAATIPGHNTRLERVIALPGLDSASTSTQAYRQLDERIVDVGRQWKAQGGASDLSDRYLHRWKHQP